MNKIIRIVKQLFCRHDYAPLICGSYVDPKYRSFIGNVSQCRHCGHVKLGYIHRELAVYMTCDNTEDMTDEHALL